MNIESQKWHILQKIVDIQDGDLNKYVDESAIAEQLDIALIDVQDWIKILIDEGYSTGREMAAGNVVGIRATPQGRLALKQYAPYFQNESTRIKILVHIGDNGWDNGLKVHEIEDALSIAPKYLEYHVENLLERGYLRRSASDQARLLLTNSGKQRVLEGEHETFLPQQPSGGIRADLGIYVDQQRLDELSSIESTEYDLSKLIRLCEELNTAYERGLFFSIAFLTRAILDHVPPIFGHKTFGHVANNYSSKGRQRSFKAQMQSLEESSRKIADTHLHSHIRKHESLPTATQVNFSNDLDVLLGEIVVILTEKSHAPLST